MKVQDSLVREVTFSEKTIGLNVNSEDDTNVTDEDLKDDYLMICIAMARR